MRLPIFLWMLISLTVLLSCSRPETYSIEVVTISEQGYGVIIDDFPMAKDHHLYKKHSYKSEGSPDEIKAYPRNPSEYSTGIDLPPFEGYTGRDLPKEVTISYQLAQLSDCKVSRSQKSWDIGSRKIIIGSPEYFTKRDCETWQPLANKRFTKTIDLTAAQDSKQLSKLGERNKNASTSYYKAILIFEFYDDGQVKVKVQSSATNPWK